MSGILKIKNIPLENILLALALLLASLTGFAEKASADFEDGLMASHRGDHLAAFREFRRLAEEGHLQSQMQLGMMYEMGFGVKQDFNEAAKWYQQAAIQGHADAHRRLVDMRRKGLFSAKPPPVPENWQGSTTDPQSQYDLGVMYFKGVGAEKDYGIAYQWFFRAANQDHPNAQNDLAVLLLKGLGVRQNSSEAYIWFLKAAEQGFADAQYNLGTMLSQGTGRGMPQHFMLAYMWFEIAARNNIMEARESQVRLAPRLQDSQLKEAKEMAARWLDKHKTR